MNSDLADDSSLTTVMAEAAHIADETPRLFGPLIINTLRPDSGRKAKARPAFSPSRSHIAPAIRPRGSWSRRPSRGNARPFLLGSWGVISWRQRDAGRSALQPGGEQTAPVVVAQVRP